MKNLGRWFRRSSVAMKSALVSAEHGPARQLVWLECDGDVVVFVGLRDARGRGTRDAIERQLRRLGVSVAVVTCPEGPGVVDLVLREPEPQDSVVVDQVLDLMRLARRQASRASLSVVRFTLPVVPVFGNETDWSAAMFRVETDSQKFGILSFPNLRVDCLDSWLANAATVLSLDAFYLLSVTIPDWEAVNPPNLEDMVSGSTSESISRFDCLRREVRTTAREVEGEQVSDALENVRKAAVPKATPSRSEFQEATASAIAYFSKGQLEVAADRKDRYLPLRIVRFDAVDLVVLPGAPMADLAMRLSSLGSKDGCLLATQAANEGGVLTAWALYRDCTYETQAVFQPHSIATGDYVAKALSSLLASPESAASV